MKKNYFLGLVLALAGSVATLPQVKAQYVFTDANLAPYQQDFNRLSGTVLMNGNQVITIPELYAQANLGTEEVPSPYTPPGFLANNGTNGTASYYHFGDTGSPDRSFGGVASFAIIGNGYVGIRLKNGSTKTIKNLEVEYAMEQWYNSGRQDEASVAVSYKRSATGITDLLGPTGPAATDWKEVPELGVAAPSTTTALLGRDGNAPSNRRVRQTTLTGVDLQVGEEIMIRWKYALDDKTNGNGLSIDDVVITPQTNVFYSTTTGNLDEAANWGVNIDGTGGGVADFAADNATYYVQGTDNTDRINGAVWTVSGTNSKIVVGRATAPATLLVAGNKNISGKIDVANGSTLHNSHDPGTGAVGFTLGTLGLTSTVVYENSLATHSILPAAYGNLSLMGSGVKALSVSIVINGSLDLNSTASLTLGNYSATIIRGGAVKNASPSAFIITNGTGALRQSVLNSGTNVLFPVGTAANSYTPVLLQQPNTPAARNEDVFSVRVLNGIFGRYNASTESGVGTAIANQNVKKTWLISEEVKGNSNITMNLQWNNTDEVTGGAAGTEFDRTKAYIGHYLTTPVPYFDKGTVAAATEVATNVYGVSRAGITSFSPFIVSSRASAPLPVQLVSFSALRAGEAVRCSWKTATELNNARFVVERSRDGKQFEVVGSVDGQGTSTLGHSYTFNDTKAPATTAYYRLRQEDTDGTSTYSAVVAVAGLTGAVELAVVPNPGTGAFQVLGLSAQAGFPGVVRNILGAQVQSISANGTFDLSAYPAGVYLVQIQTGSGLQTKRVVKQ
jgi:hypothetical protein